MLVMIGTISLLILAAIILIFLLRRTVTESPARAIRQGALRRSKLPDLGSAARHFGHSEKEIDSFLVIPDISGYTHFMQMSAYALAHAQYAVSQLLSSIIDAAEGKLATAKIEGDAIFLYGPSANAPTRHAVTGPEVGAAVCQILKAFYRKRWTLRSSSTADDC
jgi:hypothetical protein